eukprot:jgi/Tetstr1/422591/TSEL_013398.t1
MKAGGIIKHNTNVVKNMAAMQAFPGDNVDEGSSPESPANKAKQRAKRLECRPGVGTVLGPGRAPIELDLLRPRPPRAVSAHMAFQWLTDAYDRPAEALRGATSSRLKPPSKASLPVKVTPNMTGCRTDDELRFVLDSSKAGKVVVSFGSSWCSHCHEMLPYLIKYSKEFPQHKYAVAQVDYMLHEAKGIKFTPTYTFFSKGKKVDEFFGSDAQRLRDHLWLHSPLK